MQTLRGRMWRTFLGLEAVKQEGYYEQLVHQALGNKYSKRKVRACCHTIHSCSRHSITSLHVCVNIEQGSSGGTASKHTHVHTASGQLQSHSARTALMQDKAAAEGQAALTPESHTVTGMADAASPRHASQLAHPSNSMAPSDTAHLNAELDSLAAAVSPGAAGSEGSMQAPDTPQAASSGLRDTAASTDLASTIVSMSSQTLSALPTPTHPSAISAAAAQALNNELGRSLLQVPLQAGEAAPQSPHSKRLTSAYSGVPL